MNVQQARIWLERAGTVLSLLAVIFISGRLYTLHQQLDSQMLSALIMPVALLSILYGFSCAFTAFAWRDSLAQCGVQISHRDSAWIYGNSQLAKYIPGNFMHLLGRQARGIAYGIPAKPLAKSMVLEIVLLCVAGLVLGSFLLPLTTTQVNIWASVYLVLGMLIALGLAMLRPAMHHIARAVLWNVGFLMVSGLVFVFLVARLLPGQNPETGMMLYFGAVYVVAWLVGFVTPGAPAGLGVREIVALTLIGSLIPEVEILTAIIAGRMVSVLGDTLFFVAVQKIGSNHSG